MLCMYLHGTWVCVHIESVCEKWEIRVRGLCVYSVDKCYVRVCCASVRACVCMCVSHRESEGLKHMRDMKTECHRRTDSMRERL